MPQSGACQCRVDGRAHCACCRALSHLASPSHKRACQPKTICAQCNKAISRHRFVVGISVDVDVAFVDTACAHALHGAPLVCPAIRSRKRIAGVDACSPRGRPRLLVPRWSCPIDGCSHGSAEQEGLLTPLVCASPLSLASVLELFGLDVPLHSLNPR